MQRHHYPMRVVTKLLLVACVACIARSEAASPNTRTLLVAPATAEIGTAEPTESISFVLADEQLPSGKFTLSNGVEVTRSDWPALVFAKFGEASCSGALIGPNVLLTAAHCVEDKHGKLREAKLTRFEAPYSMACERHPAYVKRRLPAKASEPRGAEDYALCSIDFRGKVPEAIASMRVEVLDVVSNLKRGGAVLLTGYGCINTRIVNGKVVSTASANILRIGDANIARAPTHNWSDAAYVLIDSRGKPTPALCPGDSGGPMFVGASESKQTGMRRIVGVNSAIAAGATGRADHIVSKISALGTEEFRKWIMDWQQRNKSLELIICGVSHEAGTFPCRN